MSMLKISHCETHFLKRASQDGQYCRNHTCRCTNSFSSFSNRIRSAAATCTADDFSRYVVWYTVTQ